MTPCTPPTTVAPEVSGAEEGRRVDSKPHHQRRQREHHLPSLPRVTCAERRRLPDCLELGTATRFAPTSACDCPHPRGSARTERRTLSRRRFFRHIAARRVVSSDTCLLSSQREPRSAEPISASGNHPRSRPYWVGRERKSAAAATTAAIATATVATTTTSSPVRRSLAGVDLFVLLECGPPLRRDRRVEDSERTTLAAAQGSVAGVLALVPTGAGVHPRPRRAKTCACSPSCCTSTAP